MIEIIVFIFGVVIGSFLNVCIYRLPRKESIVFPPSRCTSCYNKIKTYHNIPIFGYLYLKGKCSNCSEKISIMYPVVELLSGLLALFLYLKFGLTLNFFSYLTLCLALVVVTFIDMKFMIIPNSITFPGILVGFLFAAAKTDWGIFPDMVSTVSLENFGGMVSSIEFLNSLFGIIMGGGILFSIAYVYKLIRKIDGMGMGDIKLLAMLGAFLGADGVVFIIFISSLIGTVVGVSLMIYNKGNLKYAIPYGPFLSLAAIIYIFTGGLTPIIAKIFQV
ncbi:MAG: prepilin peptidase [Thermodesulfobacteriota bacterium]